MNRYHEPRYSPYYPPRVGFGIGTVIPEESAEGHVTAPKFPSWTKTALLGVAIFVVGGHFFLPTLRRLL